MDRERLKAQNDKIANLISGYQPEIYTKWAIHFGAYTSLRLDQVFQLSLELGNVKAVSYTHLTLPTKRIV